MTLRIGNAHMPRRRVAMKTAVVCLSILLATAPLKLSIDGFWKTSKGATRKIAIALASRLNQDRTKLVAE